MCFPHTLLHGAGCVFACQQHLAHEQHLAACQVSVSVVCILCLTYIEWSFKLSFEYQVLVDILACYLCCSVNLQQKCCSC